MSQLDMYLKLENTRKALQNLKKKYAFLKQENERLTEELKQNKTFEISDESITTKRAAIERSCIYGYSHFCDGTVNRSCAGKGVKPLPRCPQYFKCPVRAYKLKEIVKDVKD
jgi:hypothetical protein